MNTAINWLHTPHRSCLLLGALMLGLFFSTDLASVQPCAGARLRVGIDVGHSRTAPGATSARGKTEYEFNRRFADELVERASAWPALDLFVLNPSTKEMSLQRRPDEAADRKAHVFLSIHHDSVNKKYIRRWEHNGRTLEYSDAFKGFSLFVPERGANVTTSTAIAKLIGKNLRAAGLSPTLHHAEPIAGENRRLLDPVLGVYAAPFAVLGHARVPAVLFEAGIIVNRVEEQELEDPQHRSRIQASILLALLEYCSPR